MRITVTLDEDVATLLERARARRTGGLKALVNGALRLGLPRMTAPANPRARYRTPSVDLGRCLIPSLDCIGEALSGVERERHD